MSLPFKDLLAVFLQNGSVPKAAGSFWPAPMFEGPSAPTGLPLVLLGPRSFSERGGLRGCPGVVPGVLHANFFRLGEVIFCTMASSFRPRPFRGGSTLVFMAP